jgi:hypothetical protein
MDIDDYDVRVAKVKGEIVNTRDAGGELTAQREVP